MVVYEVNLKIDQAVFETFYDWLKQHAKEMLNYRGFISANLQQDETDPLAITAVYHIDSRKNLEDYLINQSTKMREEGLQMFPNQFSATRRIFIIKDIL